MLASSAIYPRSPIELGRPVNVIEDVPIVADEVLLVPSLNSAPEITADRSDTAFPVPDVKTI